MKILFFGDIFGRSGRDALIKELPYFKKQKAYEKSRRRRRWSQSLRTGSRRYWQPEDRGSHPFILDCLSSLGTGRVRLPRVLCRLRSDKEKRIRAA